MSLQVRNQISGALERVAGFNDTDSILSPSSQNPISNRAVYTALAQKIDKTVTDLINYYDKSQTYSKPEVRALIGAINTLTIEVVSALPTQDISTTTIYFVGPAAGTNNYDEYVYVGGNWVQIGDTTIDLSNYVTNANLTTVLQDYYTKSEADALFNDYYDKDAVDDLLDTKQNTLDFDNTPIAGSQNPVTSNGIRTAISNAIISSAGGSIIKVHHLDGGTVVGDTVTASKGSFSVSSTFDNNGDAIITGVGEIGTIQITATNGTDVGVAFINTPNFSLYSTTISYGVNYKSWLEAGGLNPSSYSSLDEVLEDEEAIRRLFTIHASVDYLVSAIISDDNEDAIKIFNNDLCAKWISLRDYAMDTLPTNEHIATMMEDADKYGYGEWALVPQIPPMTSTTVPYGEVTSSAAYTTSGYENWKAFDNDDTTYWHSAGYTTSPAYIQYKFVKPTVVKKVRVKPMFYASYGLYLKNYKIQGSNDNFVSDVHDLYAGKFDNTPSDVLLTLNNNDAYLYYRFCCIDSYYISNNTYYSAIHTLQFYNWGPKGNVPVMTSNTAPYGTAIRSGIYNSREAWYAFDGNETTCWQGANVTPNSWIGYTFVNPVNVKAFKINAYINQRIITFQIEASNDNSTWTPITGVYTMGSSGVTWNSIISFNNTQYYTGYRVHVLTTLNSYEPLVYTLQFYGREMKVSVPIMTNNTTPFGEAIASSIYSTSYDKYKAFMATPDTYGWNCASDEYSKTDTAWVGYDFKIPVKIKKAFTNLLPNDSSTLSAKEIRIIARNSINESWTVVSDVITDTNRYNYIEITDNNAYRYYAVRGSITRGTTQYFEVYQLKFWGFDYSEYDWDTEHSRTYIYDHGIEPTDVITSIANASGNTFAKEPSRLKINKTSTSAWNAMYPTNQINVTDYTLARAISTEGTGINGTTSLATCSNLSTGATDSYKVMATNLAPYHQYNNMANVNIDRWVTIGFSTNVTGNIAISEWWLE